ncbi:9917_t:CDS:2 [Cetraspora pellucida]|uniref:9917_t:CDS:1 n=1 Tax=Cetraspora pellucida TaxID=1433469 RepID=A0A9N9GPH2_9GLOM|nr:9917_t:CDS:2 [Cetraspora pellucida]
MRAPDYYPNMIMIRGMIRKETLKRIFKIKSSQQMSTKRISIRNISYPIHHSESTRDSSQRSSYAMTQGYISQQDANSSHYVNNTVRYIDVDSRRPMTEQRSPTVHQLTSLIKRFIYRNLQKSQSTTTSRNIQSHQSHLTQTNITPLTTLFSTSSNQNNDNVMTSDTSDRDVNPNHDNLQRTNNSLILEVINKYSLNNILNEIINQRSLPLTLCRTRTSQALRPSLHVNRSILSSSGQVFSELRSDNKNDEQEECLLCLESLEIRGGRMIINPGCGHSLHMKCYLEYIKRFKDICSVCRKSFASWDK